MFLIIFFLQDASFWDSTYSTYASMTGRIEAIVGFSNGSSWTGNYDIPMHGGERASAFLQWVSCVYFTVTTDFSFFLFRTPGCPAWMASGIPCPAVALCATTSG